MKYLVLTAVLFFATTAVSITAQEIIAPSSLETSIAPHKSRVIVKTDLATFFQQGFALETEASISKNISFDFRGGWQKMDEVLSYAQPGTYEQTYKVIYTESSGSLFSPKGSTTTITPKPILEKSTFLPSSVIPFQASIRTYLGKSDRRNRFFIQPGMRILRYKGVHAQVDQTLVSTETVKSGDEWGNVNILTLFTASTTTTTDTYRQTCITQSTSGKTAAGLSLDFGWHFEHKGRISSDVGIRTGFNETKGIFGLQKTYFTPMLNIGVRI